MSTREAAADPVARRPGAGVSNGGSALEELLLRCTADGVITPDQADAMRRYGSVEPSSGIKVRQIVLEALGYLGGALVCAGSALLAARYWGDLATGWRLVVLGGAAGILLAAGSVVPAGSAALGRRMRAVLWVGSLGCFAGGLAVWADSVLGLSGRGLGLAVSAGCAAYAIGLWTAHRSLLQQMAMMVVVAVTAANALAYGFDVPDLPGAGVWGVGLVWIVLGQTGVVAPRRVALVLGSVMTIVGAMLTGGSDAGMALTLVTVASVILAAVLARDLILLATGIVGAVANLPAALTRWFPDSSAAAVILVIVGLLVVVATVLMALRGNASGPKAPVSH